MAQPAAGFGGSERFRILSQLGSGAMGVVYRAHDTERDREVALKVLRKVDPGAIYRFKQEFRVLADMVHPNLVPLYELFSAGDAWYFTMELVEGVDFLRFVRGEADGRVLHAGLPGWGGETSTHDTRDGSLAPDAPTGVMVVDAVPQRRAEPLRHEAQFAQLRRCLIQLVEGVDALHRARTLHRDLKPSNVMVTSEGRVVVLDFGIVTTFAAAQSREATAKLIGTPSYMAPEQVLARPLTEASDWYAVGVMLYEALTGCRPFDGDSNHVLSLKLEVEPLRPSQLGVTCPPELEELCVMLLARDHRRRPGAADILRMLGADPVASARARPTPVSADDDTLLVARDRELGALREALATVCRGQPTTVYAFGRSGMGKSALLTRFLDEVEARGEALVLTGRCFERESVPYKALDSLIDALTQYLLGVPDDQLWGVLPPEIKDLARLFPVLRRVEAVLASAALASEAPDLRELRRRAFAALRHLLRELGKRQPVILYIDDVQWGDADSAALLNEVLRQPDAPPILTILSYRSEDRERSPFLRAFLASERPAVELPVEPLDAGRAYELAIELLARTDLVDLERYGRAIAGESGGNPLFLRELVRYVAERAGDGELSLANIRLEDMLIGRVARLPPEAQRLLQTIAVAGRPIAQAVVRWASELEGDDRKALAQLRSTNLVRTQGIRDIDPVETYHDRIREAVVGQLDAEQLGRYHRRLAIGLERAGEPDPEELAVHLDAAGELDRAGALYERAARVAEQALAFEKAAALQARAIELRAPQGADKVIAWRRLGDALACCGRGREAADAYLAAATAAKASEALDLRRRGAEQLLHTGHIDAGVALLDECLVAIGMSPPRTPHAVLISLLWRRAGLKLRGLGFKPRDESQVSPEDLTRIDVCWTASIGFSMIDTLRGADFQIRQLLFALRGGERARIARALATEAAHVCLPSAGGARRARRIADRAAALAEQLGDQVALAWAEAARAIIGYQDANWREARTRAEASLAMFEASGGDVVWELSVMQMHHVWALFQLGELAQLQRLVPQLYRQAVERGDIYTSNNMCTGVPSFAWLIADQPDEARRLTEDARRRWSQNGVHLQHYWQMLSLAHVDLYGGDGKAALARLEETVPRLRAGMLMRVRMIRAETEWLQARAALAAAAAAPTAERAALLATAERCARRFSREKLAPFAGNADMIRAAVAEARGDDTAALAAVERALACFDAHGMQLHAAAARHTAGRLYGDDRGEALREDARRWLVGQGVAAPERMLAFMAPCARLALPG